MQRRDFLRQSSMAIMASAILPDKINAPLFKKNRLGLQLYSVRADMKADPAGTLEKVARMGYKLIEHANYVTQKFYGFSPAEFKKILDGLDLQMPSGHTVLKPEHWDPSKSDFTDAWKKTIDDAAFMGQQYVISPWLDESKRKNYDDILAFMEVFNQCGELCKKSGMQFGYHNHDFEFSVKLNEMTVYDIILQHTDPALVVQQLDIGNMYHAGARALDIVSRYPGRFISMHVKDEVKVNDNPLTYESTVLGKGIIPVKEIIDLGKKAGGTTLFIIEQESYQGAAPVDCVHEDLRIMNSWRF